MNLFIYASERDTFGIAVLDAMASALPVIVNDWEVMKEITNHGEYATLYGTDNIEDCLSKILVFYQEMATTQDSLKKKSAHISKVIRESYSIDNHIKGLYDVYKSCYK